MEKVKYTFEDGLEITGTIDQISTITKSLGRKLNASKFGDEVKRYLQSKGIC